MKKREIELGSVYAVGSNAPYAARATVVAAGATAGCWLVRFDEPMTTYG
jgi:hypothetical protein